MASLRADLFVETRNLLSKHFRTRADREAVLLPIVSQWRGASRIEYEGSSIDFATRLVGLLPPELLKSVLRGVSAGAEQLERIELLCERIDLATAAGTTTTDPLPAALEKPPPARRFAGTSPVLFGPLDAAPAPVDAFREMLSVEHPLLLLMDFAADVTETLFTISGDAGDSVWIDGEALLDPAGSARYANVPPGRADLASRPPSLLLVDFSAVLPERVATSLPDSDEPVSEFLSRVDGLLAWAASRNHRVVLGAPRFLLARPDVQPLRRRSVRTLVAAGLFSEEYRHRAEECERRLGRKLPFRTMLFPLLSANSAALPSVTAELLRALPVRRAFVHSSVDEPETIAVALELARGLTEAGFYEIAYRIEGQCRTQRRQRGVVALSADLRLDPEARREDSVVGFVESTTEIPATVRYATLTGGTGTGKTTALLGIEHTWLAPQPGERGRHYLPLYLPLDQRSAPDLVGRIEAHIAADSFGWFDGGNERFSMACHALVGRLGSLGGVRRLFSSPLYLLLDDVDRLSSQERAGLSRDLSRLRTGEPDVGALLACRDPRSARLLRLGDLTIRELSEHQIRSLLEARHGHASLPGVLVANGTPMSRYVRNPQLLSLLCELEVSEQELRGANLKSILELYVARRGDGRGVGDRSRRTAEDWLARTALELKLAETGRSTTDDGQEQELIATGHLLGLLRRFDDTGVLEFRFDLLLDYFAARQLAAEVSQLGVAEVFSTYPCAETGWSDVMRILVALLPARDAVRLVELLAQKAGVRQAHRCLLELSTQDVRTFGTTSALLVRRAAGAEADSGEKIEDIRALGRHDPRIFTGSRLPNMIEVPRSELMAPFQLGRYPVTNLEFAEFVRLGGYETAEWWDARGWSWVNEQKIRFPRYWLNSALNLPNQPVTGVNFFEATAYCAWLTHQHSGHEFRLPSAVEWDSAAHGSDGIFEMVLAIARGTRGRHSQEPASRKNRSIVRDVLRWLGDNDVPVGQQLAQSSELSLDEQIEVLQEMVTTITEYMAPYPARPEHGTTTPVGVFPPNRLGLHDLFGNVWQWCNTAMSMTSVTDRDLWHLPRAGGVGRGTSVIVKGGGTSGSSNPVWTLIGGWFDPAVRFHRLGFRVSCRTARAGVESRR